MVECLFRWALPIQKFYEILTDPILIRSIYYGLKLDLLLKESSDEPVEIIK